MGVDYYRKGSVTSNTIIFKSVYIGVGLFLVFAGTMAVLYLQDPFCAVGVDTVNECLLVAFEEFKIQFGRLFEGL